MLRRPTVLKLLPLLLTCFCFVTGCLPAFASKAVCPEPKLSMAYAPYVVADTLVCLYLPNKSAEYQQGLAGVDQLAPNQGMLFRFVPASLPQFWMKGCLVPLDFIYGRNNRILGFKRHVLPCVPGHCPIFSPSSPVDWVMELPAGSIKRFQLKQGETLKEL